MKWFYLLFLCLYAATTAAQTPIILLSKSSGEPEVRAARVLQFYLGKMTGQRVDIATEPASGKKSPFIFVGGHPSAKSFGFKIPGDLSEDACFLEGKKGCFALAGGGEMGAEYAAYSLLELLGCRKFSPRDSFIPTIERIQLPDYQAKISVPAVPYRELWYEPAFDAEWARWHKLKTNPQKNAEWGMFVHTFDKLCPAEKYFSEYPEYFAFNGAQRSRGQLCLSNDTVLQIVISSLRELILQKPDARYWSVSQNDNYDYCKCARCAATDQKQGGPAASLIHFVNQVAAEFPDKTISTLAYQYTRQAPKGLKPASNVNICLCSIECNRGQSIEEGCPDFARDVQEWSALTSNLMIWDYVVQFRSYLGPFPNWHTLQPNLQFFQKNGVKMMFEQGSGRDRSEFSDMRAYLLAKLMWDPQANMDSILTDFGDGYYGEARAGVWAYVEDQTRRLQKHGNRLWIYDVPQNEPFARDSIFERMMNFENILAKPADPVMQLHLEGVALVEFFSFLENLKMISPLNRDPFTLTAQIMMYADSSGFLETLHEFETLCNKGGFRHLNENGYTPAQYVQDYAVFLKRGKMARLSKSDSVSLVNPAATKYAQGDPQVLANLVVGETDYRCNWLGFEGNDMCAVVKISDTLNVYSSTIQVSFLQDQASWIFYPQKVVLEISEDGQSYKTIHEEVMPIVPDRQKTFRSIEGNFQPAKIRKVRVTAINQKKCPAWHTCNGNPSWIFADEIIVR